MQEGTVAQILKSYNDDDKDALVIIMINNDKDDNNQDEDNDGCDDDNDLSPLLGSFPPVYRVTGHVGETAQAGKDHDDDEEDNHIFCILMAHLAVP